jgi:hypothetical protein
MSEIMDDFDAGYKQGLLAGYTKSITLLRHLQRDFGRWDEGNVVAVLNEAMELIAKNIEEESEEEKSINQMKRSRQ